MPSEDSTSAIARDDEKLLPGEVPVVEFSGAVKAPHTDGKTLLVFEDEENDQSIGVRLDDIGIAGLYRHLGGFLDG